MKDTYSYWHFANKNNRLIQLFVWLFSKGHLKDCVRIKDFLLSRKAAVAAVDIDDDTTHSERTGSDDTNDVDADAGPGASAVRPLAALFGNCLVNPVCARGKDEF